MQSIRITKEQSEILGIELERLQWLDAYLQRMIDEQKHLFAAFRVWRGDTQIFSGDYGLQNPSGEPLRSDAIFPLQSLTKPVVATCAAILQEEGRVNFYDKLQDYMPEFQGENKDGVLLWHLLCHTSGMDYDETDKWVDEYTLRECGAKLSEVEDGEQRLDIFMALRTTLNLPEVERSWDAANEVDNLLTLKSPLADLPGKKFSYWGTGYWLWKDIIERITGETLEQYAKRKIFDPLGMADTHWAMPLEKYDRRVIRENVKGAPGIDSDDAMQRTSASGGLKSTMDDMARFGLMYLNNGKLDGKRIISPATVRLLTRNHNKKVPDSFWFGRWMSSSWGLGWDVKDEKIDDLGMLHSPSSYNHGGYGGARLLIDPEYNLVSAMYLCEKSEFSVYDDMGNAVDIIYGALD